MSCYGCGIHMVLSERADKSSTKNWNVHGAPCVCCPVDESRTKICDKDTSNYETKYESNKNPFRILLTVKVRHSMRKFNIFKAWIFPAYAGLNLGSKAGGTAVRPLASHQCALVQIPASTPYVGWVCWWFSPLLQEDFFGYSGFPLSSKTNISNFQFNQESGRQRTTMWMC